MYAYILIKLIGSDLVGASYLSIFSSSGDATPSKSIIHASHVTADSGTGLVHCAPAHGAEDYRAFQSLNLLSSPDSIVCHVDARGAFSSRVSDVVGSEIAQHLVGKEVLGDGGKAIVQALQTLDCDGKGRLIKIQRIKHRYPYDWKTNKPIIVT